MQRPDEQFIDPEHADDLDRSKRTHGEKVPVVIDDRTGRIVDGRHRRVHGWALELHIRTKDDLEFWKLRLAYSAQRTIGEPEKVDIFSHLGDELEKKGLSNSDIVKQLLELSHYKKSETYVKILDRELEGRGRLVSVYFKRDKAPFCDYDLGSECVHVDYAWEIPAVAAILRKAGMRSPGEKRAAK